MTRTYVPSRLADRDRWVCPDCAAVILDRDVHDRWHEKLEQATL